MFKELVETFNSDIERLGSIRARLYMNSLETRASVIYKPDNEMIIEGMPMSKVSPYFSVRDGGKVYLSPDDSVQALEEDAKFYNIYRIWDPRALVGAITRERQGSDDRWVMQYDLDLLHLDAEVTRHMTPYNEGGFYAARGRLEELTIFEDDGSTLTLVFQYPNDSN